MPENRATLANARRQSRKPQNAASIVIRTTTESRRRQAQVSTATGWTKPRTIGIKVIRHCTADAERLVAPARLLRTRLVRTRLGEKCLISNNQPFGRSAYFLFRFVKLQSRVAYRFPSIRTGSILEAAGGAGVNLRGCDVGSRMVSRRCDNCIPASPRCHYRLRARLASLETAGPRRRSNPASALSSGR
jgi:hypothetical protein